MKIAKAILQKAVTEKKRYILITVIDADVLGLSNRPEILETKLYVNPGTIYTNMMPSINVDIDLNVLRDRSDLKGLGIGGIITQESWACVDVGPSIHEMLSI